MLMFIPLFFYSNFFYSYHFGLMGILYNGRTGSLAAALYWIAQIVGSFILQACLDSQKVSKKIRAYGTFIGIVVYMAVTWVYGGYIQYSYDVTGEKQGLDFGSATRSPWDSIICLFLWGFVDSFVQVWSYWMMSQQTDEAEELACMS